MNNLIKTTEEIINAQEILNKNQLNEKSDKISREHRNKQWADVEWLNKIPNKSLESTGLDLTGFSQDDVWERAIIWFKEHIKHEGDNIKKVDVEEQIKWIDSELSYEKEQTTEFNKGYFHALRKVKNLLEGKK